MKNRMSLKSMFKKRILIPMAILTLVIPLTTGCTNDIKVNSIAEQWVMDEIDSLSGQIAEGIVGDDPIFQAVAASVISDLIQDNIHWEFSRPKRIDVNTYQVIATGYATMDVPLIGVYTMSAPFKLVVNMVQERVVDSTFDITGVRITEGRH